MVFATSAMALFRGTPSGLWLSTELVETFGVDEKLNGESAQRVYDHLQERLSSPEFAPRALLKRFGIELLCTTDAATDTLEHHRRLKDDGLDQVRPTFRPDAVADIGRPDWREQIEALSETSGIDVGDYGDYISALEVRREFFKRTGALATDPSALTPYTERLTEHEAQALFARALSGETSEDDAARFMAHMLMEFARMSVEDGLVMQLHVGSFRNHNAPLFARFGPDKGADIPVATEWTRNLGPLLNEHGSSPRLTLIAFTLDESAYGRELAPLAGHYPAMLLGPPWWFFDSPLGIQRYLDAVMETAGLYNTAGFNDDTRAFASIPSRHDVWRRVTCDWLAGTVVSGLIGEEDASQMAHEFAYGLAKKAYGLEPRPARSTR